MRSSASCSDQDYVLTPGISTAGAVGDDVPAQATVINLFSRRRAALASTEPDAASNQADTVIPTDPDFDRDVYCLMGIPIDAVDMTQTMDAIRRAADADRRCFLSTPNLNFLMGCQRDEGFRDSLVNSDLNIVDGLPIAWMARRLGIPVQSRVTGSGLFERLMADAAAPERKLSVYFFGGPDGAAAAACQAINRGARGLVAAGYQSPGFGSVEDMSRPEMIEHINASGADFLVVSLGAHKGQAWIEHNRHRLTVPVISHLGAVVNFVAGTVDRAPDWVQRFGLEWLWRIKEEPSLWRRYWSDGVALLTLLLTRLLPYAFWLRLSWYGLIKVRRHCGVILGRHGDGHVLRVIGSTADRMPAAQREVLRLAVRQCTGLTVDLSDADYLSPSFFGLMLVLRKHQEAAGLPLRFVGLSRRLRRLFRWNGVEYLLVESADIVPDALGAPSLAGATSL